MKKKIGYQITMALVCCILGFILTYQFKQVSKESQNSTVNGYTADITTELKQLTQQKEDKQKKIDELDEKVKKYETAAANKTSDEQLLLELQNSRIVNGMVDVKGKGVIITFTPNSKLFDNNTAISLITPEMLADFINNLYAYEAEAVSINDIRITPRTGILQSGNLLKVDNNYISPMEKITVKVIANQNKIEAYMKFPNQLDDFSKSYTITEEKMDELIIKKSESSFKYNYAKPVENK